MKLSLGKRSFKDVVIGDYDYKFLCMVRAAVDLLNLNFMQQHHQYIANNRPADNARLY